jgi:hypothetical protein
MTMEFKLSELLASGGALEEAAECYSENGFFVLHGLEDSLTPLFREMLAAQIGAGPAEMDEFLDPDGPPTTLPLEIRRRLAQVPSEPDFSRALLQVFGPLLSRLIGPLAHVSHTFHTQYKSPGIAAVDHGGNQNEYLEMQGQYLLHQDFTGASLPTSPSGVTLWVAQNTTPDWRLRIYPGSHKQGLICNQWLPTDDPRAAALGAPYEMESRVGSALVFNALCLHGGCEPGPSRRVSCDIRFFPLCAFLSSEVHTLDPNVIEDLRARAAAEESPTLRAPLLESLAYLGQAVLADDVEPLSVLNWTNYLHHYLRDCADEALDCMLRFTNEGLQIDDAGAYTAKYHGHPLHSGPLRQVRRVIADREPKAPELAGLDRLIERLAS